MTKSDHESKMLSLQVQIKTLREAGKDYSGVEKWLDNLIDEYLLAYYQNPVVSVAHGCECVERV